MTQLSRKLLNVGWLLAAAIVVLVALNQPEARGLLLESVRRVSGAAILITLPVQFASTFVCAAALRALRPGPSLLACCGSRLLRDATGNLVALVPGIGELAGARALVLSGGTARRAVAASALDALAETVAQIPYILLALSVIPLSGATLSFAFGRPAPALALSLAVAALAAVYLLRRPALILVARVAAGASIVGSHLSREAGRIAICVALHLIAWAMGGLQVWLAARMLGSDMSILDAVIAESAAYAMRAIFFFVPAGIGAQEVGLVAAGSALGLDPDLALSLALVLRARDVVLALPILLVWPWFEWRWLARSRSS